MTLQHLYVAPGIKLEHAVWHGQRTRLQKSAICFRLQWAVSSRELCLQLCSVVFILKTLLSLQQVAKTMMFHDVVQCMNCVTLYNCNDDTCCNTYPVWLGWSYLLPQWLAFPHHCGAFPSLSKGCCSKFEAHTSIGGLPQWVLRHVEWHRKVKTDPVQIGPNAKKTYKWVSPDGVK